MILLALAAAAAQPTDSGVREIKAAYASVRDDALVQVDGTKLASEAAKGLAEASGLAKAEAPLESVASEASLVDYFVSIRARVAGKIEERALIEGAVRSLVAATGQEGSYIDKQYFDLLSASGGGGIGVTAYLDIDDKVPTVLSAVAGSPSDGRLIKGDRIRAIDGSSTDRMTLAQFMVKLRGAVESTVVLDVERGTEGRIPIRLTRAVVMAPPSVTWRTVGSVGILKIASLGKSTTRDVRDAVLAIRKSVAQPTGYIIDLRGNQGGLLDTAIEVADHFMNSGEIVSQRGRTERDVERFRARPGDLAKGAPLAVLIDNTTAAGAEIIAAALQDSKRAKLIGERTMGKGRTQTLIPLSDSSALRLTTAEFFAASGRTIQGVGVQPDIGITSTLQNADTPLEQALITIEDQKKQ